jgi:hypothetical protein
MGATPDIEGEAFERFAEDRWRLDVGVAEAEIIDSSIA